MNTYSNIPLEYSALLELVLGRPIADKIALVRELEKETFSVRFSELTERIRSRNEGIQLSEAEVLDEINTVRRERYKIKF